MYGKCFYGWSHVPGDNSFPFTGNAQGPIVAEVIEKLGEIYKSPNVVISGPCHSGKSLEGSGKRIGQCWLLMASTESRISRAKATG